MELRSGTVTKSKSPLARSTATTCRHFSKTQQQVFSSKKNLATQNVPSKRFDLMSCENESKQERNILVVHFCLFCVFCITIFFVYHIVSCFIRTKPNPVEIYTEGLQNLSASFREQSPRLWNVLKVLGLTHLKSWAPTRPLVVLLAGPPDAREVVSCLALKLARLIDSRNEERVLTINGVEHSSNEGGATKKELDRQLANHFETGYRVVVIKQLEALPPTSPLLFHSYCDDQNAPYKDAVLIFTINLHQYPNSSLSPVEAEGTVEKYLANEVWTSPPYEQNAVAALLSRVANTVVLVHSEEKSAVDRVCP